MAPRWATLALTRLGQDGWKLVRTGAESEHVARTRVFWLRRRIAD